MKRVLEATLICLTLGLAGCAPASSGSGESLEGANQEQAIKVGIRVSALIPEPGVTPPSEVDVVVPVVAQPAVLILISPTPVTWKVKGANIRVIKVLTLGHPDQKVEGVWSELVDDVDTVVKNYQCMTHGGLPTSDQDYVSLTFVPQFFLHAL